MSKTLVEVCIGSVDDALAAEQAGANRVELCGATEIGGLTPSAGLIESVTSHCKLPVMVMIRPRAGGFCYSEKEFETALNDARQALQYPIAGVVFGFLQQDGRVDVERCREVVKLANGRDTVFHRAFDVVPDPMTALDQLIEVGVTRILTSGQQISALEGVELISNLIEHAQGRVQILPGGGIRANNVQQIITKTGCQQVHIGASAIQYDQSLDSNLKIDFHSAQFLESGQHRVVDQDSVADVMNQIAS